MAPFRGHALRLDGASALLFPSREPPQPLQGQGGAFTAECWVRGAPPRQAAAILGNRHCGGFGLTWATPQLGLDRPTGWVNVSHVPGTQRAGYLLLRPVRPWRWEDWHHLALTYDGRLARLFVDGVPSAEAIGLGRTRTGTRPFLVGADPDARGEAGQFFVGEIGGVRISSAVRYHGPFRPPVAWTPDAVTTLLLDFEDTAEPFADRSAYRAEPRVIGRPQRVPVR